MPDIKGCRKPSGSLSNGLLCWNRRWSTAPISMKIPAHALGHNERLEFLGDAVLDFIVADKLYQDFPDLSEGEMTRLRAALVRAGYARPHGQEYQARRFSLYGEGGGIERRTE